MGLSGPEILPSLLALPNLTLLSVYPLENVVSAYTCSDVEYLLLVLNLLSFLELGRKYCKNRC